MACRPGVVWGALLAAAVVAEAHGVLAKHHDCTLSAVTRQTFRTEHPAGRIAFVIGSAALALWFQYHIVAWKRESLDDAIGLAPVFELHPQRAQEQQ